MAWAALVAVLAGVAAAALFIAGASGEIWGLFVGALTPLPLMLAGLGWGLTAGGIACAFAVALVLGITNPLLASVLSGLLVIPTFLVLRGALLSRKTEDGTRIWLPAEGIIQVTTVVGLLMVGGVALALGSQPEGITGTVRAGLATVFRAGERAPVDPYRVEFVEESETLVIGLGVAALILAIMGCGAFAQGILATYGQTERPSPVFRRLALPDWPRVALVLAIAATVAADQAGWLETEYIAMGATIVLLVPFVLQGIAVAHQLTRGMMMQPLVLALVYLIALTFYPIGPGLFAAIGFFDRWGNFRSRFAGSGDPDEED